MTSNSHCSQVFIIRMRHSRLHTYVHTRQSICMCIRMIRENLHTYASYIRGHAYEHTPNFSVRAVFRCYIEVSVYIHVRYLLLIRFHGTFKMYNIRLQAHDITQAQFLKFSCKQKVYVILGTKTRVTNDRTISQRKKINDKNSSSLMGTNAEKIGLYKHSCGRIHF